MKHMFRVTLTLEEMNGTSYQVIDEHKRGCKDKLGVNITLKTLYVNALNFIAEILMQEEKESKPKEEI